MAETFIDQRAFVALTKLPTETENDLSEYEDMGFVFGELDPSDDLFRKAKLPLGWERKPSDHAMWTDIIDDRGIERVRVFYKVSPRKAFMRLIDNVGAALVDRAIREPELDIPWESLLDFERKQVIVRMIELDKTEPRLDVSRHQRIHERLRELWEQAEQRARDDVRKWCEVLSES